MERTYDEPITIMPIYVYKKGSKTKDLHYPFGEAPDEIGGWERIITGFPEVVYKGEGWTGAGQNKYRKGYATWSDVENYLDKADKMAKEDEKQKTDHLTNVIADSL